MWSIPDLPEGMRDVPEDRLGWFAWREKVLAYRTLIRRLAEEDPEIRAGMLAACARDYAYAMCVLGVLLEPRNVRDFQIGPNHQLKPFVRRKGWYPWVPYAIQVEMIRTIDDALATDLELNEDGTDTGPGDIVMEKSRDVGATTTFCFYASMDWVFAEDVLAGCYSFKEDAVDNGSPKSMFYKIRAQVGVNPKVPAVCHAPKTIFDGIPVRMPHYLKPSGFDPKKHDRRLQLTHPTKTNEIGGESTSGKSSIGDRLSYALLDEISKHDTTEVMWDNMNAVTDHRFGFTSPDRTYGDGAYQLVELARRAKENPDVAGPRLISVHWQSVPTRDHVWERRQRRRFAKNPVMFDREYGLDWNAGRGDWVYPLAKYMKPDPSITFLPGLGEVVCTLDPAISDPTAAVWLQHVPGLDPPWRVIEAITLKTPSAHYMTPILMGFPQYHPERLRYEGVEMADWIHEVMDFTWDLRRAGTEVIFYGDTYGKHTMGSNSESYYDVLFAESERLYLKYQRGDGVAESEVIDVPEMEIIVRTKTDEKSRFHQRRKDDLNKMLPRMGFADTPRVRYVLEAVKNNQYKPQDELRLMLNEPQQPAHNWTSHPTTALEYFAVNSVLEDLVSGPMLKPGASRGHVTSYDRAESLPAGYTRLPVR